MEIEKNDIRGVQEDDKMLCPKCYLESHPDFSEVTYGQFVQAYELEKFESKIWFCDSCGNQI